MTTSPYRADEMVKYIASTSACATTPSIIFHHLTAVSLPPSAMSSPNHETLMLEILRLNNPNVHQALLSISTNFTIKAFIMDFFCGLGLPVAMELNIPSYFFFTSGAACLGLFLYLPTIHNNTEKSLRDLNALLSIPGMPPLPSSDMPKPLIDRNDIAYQFFLENSIRYPKSAGIIINTFESVESRALRAISDGLCLPDNIPTPPIYSIGPLIVFHNQKGGCDDVPECLTWLDSQPRGSVVFLCFGSLALFSMDCFANGGVKRRVCNPKP